MANAQKPVQMELSLIALNALHVIRNVMHAKDQLPTVSTAQMASMLIMVIASKLALQEHSPAALPVSTAIPHAKLAQAVTLTAIFVRKDTIVMEMVVFKLVLREHISISTLRNAIPARQDVVFVMLLPAFNAKTQPSLQLTEFVKFNAQLVLLLSTECADAVLESNIMEDVFLAARQAITHKIVSVPLADILAQFV